MIQMECGRLHEYIEVLWEKKDFALNFAHFRKFNNSLKFQIKMKA
jgi:hypothetical protein